MSSASRQLIRQGTGGSLDCVPWKNFPYKPHVTFHIASYENFLLLNFSVCEQEVRYECKRDNERVYEDSAVEFFMALCGDKSYYNLEFNCIGTALVYYGENREERVPVEPSLLSGIKRYSSIRENGESQNSYGMTEWSLFLAIPSNLFMFSDINTFSGLSFDINLYKCGDKLLVPHYITWNHIDSENPDFHRREFLSPVTFL
jgi:hypothetical protein